MIRRATVERCSRRLGSLLAIAAILLPAPGLAQSDSAILSGYVRDHSTGQPLPGASVIIDNGAVVVSTDLTGRFFVELPAGEHVLTTEHGEHARRSDSVTLFGDERADVEVHLGRTAAEGDGLMVTARTKLAAPPPEDDFEIEGGVVERPAIEAMLPNVSSAADLLRGTTSALVLRQTLVRDVITGVDVPALCVELTSESTGKDCRAAIIAHNDVVHPYGGRFLREVDPRSIERIEVLNPSEAVFRFGFEAGHGALVIFTR